MPTLSIRQWKREVRDRQDDLDHLPLSDLHADPSPCNPSSTIITFQSQIYHEGVSLSLYFFITRTERGGVLTHCGNTEYQLNHSRSCQTADKAPLLILKLLNTGYWSIWKSVARLCVQGFRYLYHPHTLNLI